MAKKKKKSNKLIYILIGVVVLLIVVAMVGKSAGWIGKTQEIEVDLAEVSKTTIIEKVSASGSVQPVTEVKLSPDVPGEIIELNVVEGDSVVAGKLLVKIRPDNFVNALKRAQANYNQNKANLASSRATEAKAEATYFRGQADYKRNKELWDEKVISESDWELAEQNFKIAHNDLESAKQNVEAAKYILLSSRASVEDAKENLRLTSVFAPVSGIVSKLSVEKGERVVGTQQMAGTEMLRIADLNKMEVRVDVNENDIIRVSVRDTAIIDVDAYTFLDKKFKGIVTSIANTANDKVSQDAVTEFEVKVRILNSSYSDLVKEGSKFPFRPGMTASVDIITDSKEDVLSVPLSAVTTRNPSELIIKDDDDEKEGRRGNRSKRDNEEQVEVVFLNDEGKAKLVKVETGISDFENIEIKSGISEGDNVISGPFLAVSRRLKNGDTIKDKNAEKEGKSKEK